MKQVNQVVIALDLAITEAASILPRSQVIQFNKYTKKNNNKTWQNL